MLHVKDFVSGILGLLEISPDDRPGAVKILFRKSGVPLSSFTTIFCDVITYHLHQIDTLAKEKKCDPRGIGIVRSTITGINGPNLYQSDFCDLILALNPLLQVEEIKSQPVIAN